MSGAGKNLTVLLRFFKTIQLSDRDTKMTDAARLECYPERSPM